MTQEEKILDKNNPLSYIKLLEPKVKDMFKSESSGHDIDHLQRVSKLALHIQEKEGGDRLIIGISAYLHDIHRLVEKETGNFCPPKNSLPEIQKILDEVDFPEDKIGMVLHGIEFHEEYGFSSVGKTVSDIETLILQDADNLDAIGAIGIGRTFAYHGSKGDPLWNQEIPIDRNIYDESQSDPDAIHHFYSKLLKLSDNMNTVTAKQMASERHKFMEEFVNRFIREWDGEI